MSLPVSVLMAVYDGERPEYLDEALQSLVKQSCPPIEVVIVCDGPLNPVLNQVLAQYERLLPLKLVRRPQRSGLALALNAALPICSCEWVARFDSDDVCTPGRLRSQWQFHLDHPDIDVFGSSILEFDTSVDRVTGVREVVADHGSIVAMAKRRNPMNHMTVMYRKSAVLGVGGYPRAHLYEDYSLWVRMILAGYKFANMRTPIVWARAGAAMVDRRGGIRYLVAESRAQLNFYRLGFLRLDQFLLNVVTRGAVRLAPKGVRRWIYLTALRKAVQLGKPDN